jgi:hypothetical protein
VDTYTIDIEAFDRICLNEKWSFEISGGVRYNEFGESIFSEPGTPNAATRLTYYSGWGGVLGLEAKRSLGCGSWYARARGAIMSDNKSVQYTQPSNGVDQNARLLDMTLGMTELSFGYEMSRILRSCTIVRARVGYEWQNWFNYSESYSDMAMLFGALPPGIVGGPSDVGFNGITFMASIER